MKIKNRIILSIGSTASVVAPVATVVACGTTKETSQTAIEQRELWSKAQNLIETKYQEMLISEVSVKNTSFNNAGASRISETNLHDYDSADFPTKIKDEIKDMIFKGIYSNSTYLSTTFGDKLLHMVNPNAIVHGAFFSYDDLTRDGLYDFFLPSTDITTNSTIKTKVEAIITKYMPVIWNNNVSNIKNVVYQTVISNYYLDVDKDNWAEVFFKPTGSTGKITGIEGNIEPSEFVLSQKVLRAKFAFDWSVALTDQASKSYISVTKTENELNTMLKAGGDIYNDETATQQRAILPTFFHDSTASGTDKSIWGLINESKDLSGFAGLVDKSALASSEAKIKQVTGPTVDDAFAIYDQKYEGYINNEKTEVIEDPANTPNGGTVNLTTPTNSKVTIEKVLLIMPSYVNGQLTMESLQDTDGSYKTLKSLMIFKQGQDIYQEALKYYASKDNHQFNWDEAKKVGGIRLTILDDSLRKVALDTFGLNYVNKDSE